jgi:hypothetical protein
MARITAQQLPPQQDVVVERRRVEPERRTIPVWVWPLIPLLLGALALGMSLNDTDESARGNTVTDMLAVVGTGDQAGYADRRASFANVTVQSVVGDRGFWIGPDAARQLFVVIDEANAGISDNAVQIVPGQVLTVNGQLERLPSPDQASAEWGLDASSSAALADQDVYLHATEVLGQ